MDFEQLTIPRQRLERGLGLSGGRHVRLQQSGLFADLGGGKGRVRNYTVQEAVSLAAALDLLSLGAPIADAVKVANRRSAYAAGLEGETELTLATQGRDHLGRVPSHYHGARVVLPLDTVFRRGVLLVLAHAMDTDNAKHADEAREAFSRYIAGLRQANATLANAVQEQS